jgi:hypothetical protein
MTTENDGWTAAKLGEQLSSQGDEHDLEDSPSYWWTPFVENDEILRALLLIKESYQPETLSDHLEDSEPPDRAENCRLFRQMFRTGAGIGISKALQQSDLDRQSAMIGLPERADAGGTGKLLELVDRIESGYIGYMFGNMGNGKTDFAIYLAELWDRINSETTFGSNIETFERAETIQRYENLPEWIESTDKSLFIWDEASSNASGYSAEAHEVMAKLRTLLQSFRKERTNLIIIGHTGKDVHPHIRRQATDIIHKESKKTATVYSDISEQGEGEDEQISLDGIEPTTWEFDTKEMSRWFWNS